MNLHYIVLVIVVILGVYIGLETNINQTPAKINEIAVSKENAAKEPERNILSKEEQQAEFKEFKSQVMNFANKFEEMDAAIAHMADQNITKVEAYNHFSKVRDLMEEGQRLPLGNLVPEGFSKEHEAMMNKITDELYNTFQYRKFAYEHFMDYIETDDLEKQATAKQWLNDGHSSLQTVAVELGILEVELGLSEAE